MKNKLPRVGGTPAQQAERKALKEEKVLNLILAGKTSPADIARTAGIPKDTAEDLMRMPKMTEQVAKRLKAAGPTGHATVSIGNLILVLTALSDKMISEWDNPDTNVDANVQNLLTYLSALTGTLDRLSKAGINLDALMNAQQDDTQLNALLVETYLRGLTWASSRTPERTKRAARLLTYLLEKEQT